MAAKTTYTESELAQYANRALGPLSASVGLVLANGDYAPIVDEALLEYGVVDVSEVSGIAPTKLLLACVRLHLWKHVTNLTNGKFQLGTSGTSLSLHQINDHARESADAAQSDVDRFRADLAYSDSTGATAGTPVAQIYSVRRPDAPFERGRHCRDEFSQ
ncbi:MAG: hypothetical protein WC655_21355 [Candidatus Hydrogenedentales bacterium]|jgi:hypothetical protein